MLKLTSVVDVPLVLDPTVGWDTSILSYFNGCMLHLEHCATLGAKLVQVFVEITQEVEEEYEAHTEEEWKALLGINQGF